MTIQTAAEKLERKLGHKLTFEETLIKLGFKPEIASKLAIRAMPNSIAQDEQE